MADHSPRYHPSSTLSEFLRPWKINVSCDEKPLEDTEEVGSAGEDLGMGSSAHAGVGDLFKDSGTYGSSPWFGYMGDDPPHGTGLGRVQE